MKFYGWWIWIYITCKSCDVTSKVMNKETKQIDQTAVKHMTAPDGPQSFDELKKYDAEQRVNHCY